MTGAAAGESPPPPANKDWQPNDMNTIPFNEPDGRLRPLQSADAPSIAAAADDPAIARWLRNGFPSPYTLADAESFIADFAEREEGERHLGIEVDGRVVGVIGVVPGTPGDVHERTAEVGYWLGASHWGRGIATAAVTAMTRSLFAETELVRLQAAVYEGNRASCRVLEKAGFTKEATLRSYVFKRGEILDAHLYAAVRDGVRPG